jgi:catalase
VVMRRSGAEATRTGSCQVIFLACTVVTAHASRDQHRNPTRAIPKTWRNTNGYRATPRCGRTPGPERFWVKYQFKTHQGSESGALNDVRKERT